MVNYDNSKTEFDKLNEDNQVKNRKCQQGWGIIIPIIEVILIAIFGFLSFRTEFKKPQDISKSFQILTSKSDLMQRQCGFDNTLARYDLQSPNIQNVVEKDEEQYPIKEQVVQLCEQMILTYNQNTEWNFNCQDILYENKTINQQQYNNFTTNIYNQLPKVGSIAIYTENGIICQNKEEDSCPSNTDGAYICLQEFFDITKQNGITLTDTNQIISEADYNAAQTQLEALNLKFLTNMCRNIQTSIYNHQKFDKFSVCIIDETQSITRVLSSYINIPDYISYLIQYFMQFLSNFVTEFEQQWKSILFTLVPIVVYSYASGLIIRYAAQIVMILSSFLPAGLVFIVIFLLSQFIHKTYNNDNMNFTLFGYNKVSQYFTFGLLLIIDIILALVFVGSTILIYQAFSKNKQTANMIKICAPIMRKRFRMKFLPIILIIIMAGISMAILYVIFITIYNSSFNGALSISSFEYMTSDYIIKKDAFKITLIVILAITGIHMIFFIVQTNRYLISSLTYEYYNQRISPQFYPERFKYISDLYRNQTDPQRLQKAKNAAVKIQEQINTEEVLKYFKSQYTQSRDAKLTKEYQKKARQIAKSLANQNQDISQRYFDIGLKTSYKNANTNYMKQFGLLFLMTFIQVLMIIPRIFLLIVRWIGDNAKLQRFQEQETIERQQMLSSSLNVQVEEKKCCKKSTKEKSQTVLDKIMASTDKLTLQYFCLTGCGYKNSIKHSNYLYLQNANLINTEHKINKAIIISFKFIIVICANITWALLLQKWDYLDGTDQVQYKLTPFIVITIFGFIVSDMILQLIEVTNNSMIYIFNYENMLIRQKKITVDQATQKLIYDQCSNNQENYEHAMRNAQQINIALLPKDLKDIITKQHLQDPHKVFNYKETFSTMLIQ